MHKKNRKDNGSFKKNAGEENMGLIDKLKELFKKEPEPEKAPEAPEKAARQKKTCKGCGKQFSYDPSWDFVPNYCKECKQKFVKEKEEKQRAGTPRKIKRKCRECGNYFMFDSTLARYPSSRKKEG